MSNNKSLYLFTFQYPYATRESFAGDELVYLAKRFDRVYIVPDDTSGNKPMRKIPENCEVIIGDNKKQGKFKYFIKGVFSLRSFGMVVKEFFGNAVYKNKVKLKSWVSFTFMLNNLLHNERYKKIEKNLCKNDVCYFYWGVGKNVLSIFWKDKAHMVSRFHGDWDLWEESYHGYIPFRKSVAISLDTAAFISKKGEEYFKKRYPDSNTKVFALGSKDCGVGPQINSEIDVLNVVSCSTMWKLKRVDLIFDSLNAVKGRKIIWTHIGDGPEFENIKERVSRNKKEHLTVNLIGRLNHDDVLRYYQTHQVDLFINLSTIEGVPVSIMEAASFNIPVLATNVGSTFEAVTEQVGELVSPNPTPQEVADRITKMSQTDYSPRTYWETHYNAEINYNAFANMMEKLD
ncbi:MAG: glycosyltransferase [bacterium]|nr:glycosyltransferase [Candidatus Limimorpha caballi]